MDLSSAVSHLATTPKLLVISDFDGTLAGFSPDPLNVPVESRSVAALAQLAELPATQVALLSGRQLAELQQVSGLSHPVQLVGSHGAEVAGAVNQVPAHLTAALQQAEVKILPLLEHFPGAYLEKKPYHRVVHWRTMQDQSLVGELLEQVQQIEVPGLIFTAGNMVLEIAADRQNKGDWLSWARTNYQATAVLFVGDDFGDVPAFAALTSQDVGILIGSQPITAQYHLPDPAALAPVLAELLRQRKEFLAD